MAVVNKPRAPYGLYALDAFFLMFAMKHPNDHPATRRELWENLTGDYIAAFIVILIVGAVVRAIRYRDRRAVR